MTGPESTQQALNNILNARSLALVGATADPTKFGHMTLKTILGGGYRGGIYLVNPKGGLIEGLPVYRSLAELPERPELVIIAVAAELVARVIDQAAQLGVRAGLILTAGFREAGRKDLEQELVEAAGRHGLRFLGPNVAGFNHLPNHLCAMFFPLITARGPLGIVSQSGSVTNALSEWAADEGLGISTAVNLGNQTDLAEVDVLEFLAADDNTRAIALYLEGVKDGRRFIETIRRIGREKPIAVLKGGRTADGRRSAASHTGSLAGDHKVFGSVCRQFGLAPVGDLESLYDCAKALATLGPPRGGRVFFISSSGGSATLGVDEGASLGLSFPRPGPAFEAELAGLNLSPLVHPGNPFDLSAVFPEPFERVLSLADRHDLADLFVVSFADPVPGGGEMVIDLAGRIRAGLAVVYFAGGQEEKAGRVQIQRAGLPVFPSPERAMRGLAAAVNRAAYLRRREEGGDA